MRFLRAVPVLVAGLSISISQIYAEEAVIHKGSKVSFDYVLTADNKVVDSSQVRGPLEYTQGDGKLIPGLTKELEGMKVGDEKTVQVKPEEAYGNPDPAGIREMPLSSIPADIKPEVGAVLRMQDQNGQSFPARITEIKKDSIVVDLNHPLAGKALTFKVKIVSVS
ncbi:MAG: peptidylprolyl isomerase [Candidatus Omnitrophota bacterium]